jgi:hypothetical protein
MTIRLKGIVKIIQTAEILYIQDWLPWFACGKGDSDEIEWMQETRRAFGAIRTYNDILMDDEVAMWERDMEMLEMESRWDRNRRDRDDWEEAEHWEHYSAYREREYWEREIELARMGWDESD